MSIKFKETVHEIFSYKYHAPQFQNDYIREEGVYLFETTHKGKKVEVKLETANSYYGNDYNAPEAVYDISEILVDGENIDIGDIESDDYDLYEAINDLRLNCTYSKDPEDYIYTVEGEGEDNFGIIVSGLTYKDMKDYLNKKFFVSNAKLA